MCLSSAIQFPVWTWPQRMLKTSSHHERPAGCVAVTTLCQRHTQPLACGECSVSSM